MSLRSFERLDPEDVVHQFQGISESMVSLPVRSLVDSGSKIHLAHDNLPRFNHFEECPNRCHTSNNMSLSGPTICHSDDRPREGKEFLERLEEHTP